MKNYKLPFLIFAILSFSLIYGCGATSSATGGEVTGVSTRSWNDPQPYGMVLIDRGSIAMGPAEYDSVWQVGGNPRGVSVDAFWMDETEVTNAKYRQFVNWVRDSIIRERLYDPAFGGNEDYKITEDRDGNPVTPRLNWNKAIPWRNPTEDEERAIMSLYRINPLTGVRELDTDQLNYRYETYDHAASMLRKNRKDPRRREYNTDLPVPTETPVISKDTAYIDENGEIVRRTIKRGLTGEYDFLNTYIVNIYPDTTVWVNDFENSNNDRYVRTYFSHAGYDQYPVVGVSWEQANAYCRWRTDFLRRSMGKEGADIEPFRLPTEAEWEYAARAGINENRYPWDGDLTLSDDRGCFYANFKPNDGNYVKDGHIITSKVGTFAPNDYGLYDMAGNVSEWTSTAFNESIDRLTSDVNPEYSYAAAPDDPYRMKRKIVRGGSWKDVAHNIRSDIRMWEYENEQRSFIGFRCVRTATGFAKGQKQNTRGRNR